MLDSMTDRLMGNETQNGTAKLFVKIGTHLSVVSIANIVYIQASGDYIDITLATGEVLHSKNKITHFEDRLPKNLFVRIHRSLVLNKQHIREIKAKQNSYEFTLTNDVAVVSGPTYRKYIRELFFLNLAKDSEPNN